MSPNFLIIGAPRTGTTHLYKGLRQHPEIYMSDFKEPMFFAYEGESHAATIADWDSYQKLFDHAQGQKAIGEASTLYLWKDSAPGNIYRHLPEVRLIAVLRNPVERAFSQYTFQRLLEVETCETFEEGLEAEASRAEDPKVSDFFRYVEVGLYADQIARYQALFAPDQLKFVLNDDLDRDQSQVFQDIFRFLGVDDTFRPNLEHRTNASGVAPKKSFYGALKAGGRMVKGLLPESMTTRLSGALNAHYLARPQVSQETYQKLLNVFQEDVIRTGKLIERDLSAWLEGPSSDPAG